MRWPRWLLTAVFGSLVYPLCTRGDQLCLQRPRGTHATRPAKILPADSGTWITQSRRRRYGRAQDRRAGSVRCRRCRAGQLVPPAPAKPATSQPVPIPHRDGAQPRALPQAQRARSSTSCAASGSSTCHQPRCGPRSSTEAATSARSPPSTGCCAPPGRAGNGGARLPTGCGRLLDRKRKLMSRSAAKLILRAPLSGQRYGV